MISCNRQQNRDQVSFLGGSRKIKLNSYENRHDLARLMMLKSW
jgi:hypothetical protein